MGQSRGLHDRVTVKQCPTHTGRRCGFDEGRRSEPTLHGAKAFEDVDQAKHDVRIVTPPVPQNANGLRRGRRRGVHGGHQLSDANDHAFWRLQAAKHVVHAGPVMIGQEQSEPFVAKTMPSSEGLESCSSRMAVHEEVLQDPVFVHHRQGLIGKRCVKEP